MLRCDSSGSRIALSIMTAPQPGNNYSEITLTLTTFPLLVFRRELTIETKNHNISITMHILQLPTELLQSILINSILERGIRRALRLRVVCKRFAEGVMPALYHTCLLDAHCSAHGQPPAGLRAHYLMHRILAEKRYLTPELRAIKRTANALMVENGIPMSDDDTREKYLLTLCMLATRAGSCLRRYFRRNADYHHNEDEEDPISTKTFSLRQSTWASRPSYDAKLVCSSCY